MSTISRRAKVRELEAELAVVRRKRERERTMTKRAASLLIGL